MRTYGRITTSNLLPYAPWASFNVQGALSDWGYYENAQGLMQVAGGFLTPYFLRFQSTGTNPRIYSTVRPTLAAGQSLTVSGYIRAPLGYTAYLGAKGYTAASAGSETSQYAFTTAKTTGGWQLISASDIVQAAGPYPAIWAGLSGNVPAGISIDLSAAVISSSSATQQLWVEVDTDSSGNNDLVYLTTLCQVLKLSLGESPFYSNYGLPARQSVMQQVWPDYYVALVQQTFSPYFSMLAISKQTGTTTPTYNVTVITHSGVSLSAVVQVPT